MTPETQNNEEMKRLLLENNRLLMENNEILRKMRRGTLISAGFKIIYLLIFFAVPVYVYYTYLQPNIAQLHGQIESLRSVSEEASGVLDWYKSVNP